VGLWGFVTGSKSIIPGMCVPLVRSDGEPIYL
jgi:hypothetical protein